MSAEFDIASPRASELFESLRAFGYDLPTALADIIDNSIAAKARNVWIEMTWAGRNSRISIRDDGRGMTEDNLVQAMRPGSLSPLTKRSPDDLGRFGLGMKTASISQCRCLTVASKVERSSTAVRRWDLDYISSTGNGEWRLLKGNALLSDEDRAPLEEQLSGTILFWDSLDQLVGDVADDDVQAQMHFRQNADAVKQHLAMVFHRFLVGRNSLNIHLNGRKVEPWDPFMEAPDLADPQPSESLGVGESEIEVKPFVLPHHSRISAEQHASAAGPRGWNAHQGFYVYRNRRLLVAGDWLGLGMQKEEHFKLARIRVDLSNACDLTWQLDVKKSQATPPASMRKDLQRIARATRTRASSIYRHRGRILQRQHGDNQVFVWTHRTKHGKSFYKINREHPLVSKAIRTASDEDLLRALLSLVEQTVPVPLIAINNAESPDTFAQPFEDSPTNLREAMTQVFGALLESGHDRSKAAYALATMEPFNQFPEVVAGFLDELSRDPMS